MAGDTNQLEEKVGMSVGDIARFRKRLNIDVTMATASR